MFKKLFKRFKKYDLCEMEDFRNEIQRIKKLIASWQKRGNDYTDILKPMDSKSLSELYIDMLATLISEEMAKIQMEYPLEVYITIYEIFHDDLDEVAEHYSKLLD